MRVAARTDSNKREIVKALEERGAFVYDLKQPVDLLVGYKARTILLELKRPKVGTLTPAQKKFFDTWPGGELWIVRSVKEAMEVLDQ